MGLNSIHFIKLNLIVTLMSSLIHYRHPALGWALCHMLQSHLCCSLAEDLPTCAGDLHSFCFRFSKSTLISCAFHSTSCSNCVKSAWHSTNGRRIVPLHRTIQPSLLCGRPLKRTEPLSLPKWEKKGGCTAICCSMQLYIFNFNFQF